MEIKQVVYYKINKTLFHQNFKKLCIRNYNIKKVKRQVIDWEKMCCNISFRLVSRLYKEEFKNKTKQFTFKIGQSLEKKFDMRRYPSDQWICQNIFKS